MRVLGISGSLRQDSYNHALLRVAAERLPAGVELIEFDRLREIPPYDADLEAGGLPAPDAVEALRGAMREADAVLVATPEYNHSIPGVLKNALDWASRPAGESALMGTPAAVIGALGGRVVETELPVPHAAQAFAGGELALSREQTEVLDELLAELVSEVEELREGLAERVAA